MKNNHRWQSQNSFRVAYYQLYLPIVLPITYFAHEPKVFIALSQNAYHPKLIVAILIYAYSQGVSAPGKSKNACKEDLSFMFIAQMNCPNFRVLSDFRKDHAIFFRIVLSKRQTSTGVELLH